MNVSDLLPLIVFLPLIASVIVAVIPTRGRGPVTIGAVLATTAVSVLIILEVARSERVEVGLGGWDVPLGIALHADGASAMMLALTCTVMLAVSVAGTAERRLIGTEWFWPLLMAGFAALNGVFIAADLFTLYVLLELLTLAAVALVALEGGKAAAAALRYLIVAVIGSLLYLFAVALLYADAGSLALTSEPLDDGPVLTAVLVLMSVGMAAKMALFPLHAWLPVAHPAAPPAVSAVLSALVVKAALFVLWRVYTLIAPASEISPILANALAALGAIGVVWGGFMALRRRSLKTIIAYSTVAQMGYLVLMLPLLESAGGSEAWSGGVLLAVGHGLAKAALFLAAGALVIAYGTDELDSLEGAISRMPWTVATIGVAGVSLAGLPPSLGFVGKWQLLQASLADGAWWWLIVLLAGGLLTFAYVGMMIRATFNPPGEDTPAPASGTPHPIATAVPFALALASIVVGLVPAEAVAILGGGG